MNIFNGWNRFIEYTVLNTVSKNGALAASMHGIGFKGNHTTVKGKCKNFVQYLLVLYC